MGGMGGKGRLYIFKRENIISYHYLVFHKRVRKVKHHLLDSCASTIDVRLHKHFAKMVGPAFRPDSSTFRKVSKLRERRGGGRRKKGLDYI